MKDKIRIKLLNVWKKYVIERENFTFLKEKIVSELFRSRIREEIWALKNVSFELKSGECLGVIGKNAAGKSTLLKIIAGIIRPTKGKVYTFGKIAAFLGLGSGFEEELTGKENIYLQASLLGMKRKEIDEIYPEIIDFSELFDFTDVKLKNYSEGMKARLGFSIMAHMNADIMLIDDILAVGDFHFQKKCIKKIEEIKNEGKTIVFVSHDLSAVKKYCDFALYLHRGEVMDFGPSKKVVEEYENHLNSGFIEYPMLVDKLNEKNEFSISQILKNSSNFNIKDITFPEKIHKGKNFPKFIITFYPNMGEKVLLTLNNHIHSFQIVGIPIGDKVEVSIDPAWLMKGDYMVTLTILGKEKNIYIPNPLYFRVEGNGNS
jgi:ABC-type polysaccharide/polyol phosphate transport system ATPase subunit